jgi:hypothetical protein
MLVLAICGSFKPPLLKGFQAIITHQSGDTVLANGKAVLNQFGVHPGIPVRAIRQLKMLSDMRQVDHVIQLTPGWWSILPGGVTADAKKQQIIHPAYIKVSLRRIDQPELHFFVSWAKKAVAFLTGHAPDVEVRSPCVVVKGPCPHYHGGRTIIPDPGKCEATVSVSKDRDLNLPKPA